MSNLLSTLANITRPPYLANKKYLTYDQLLWHASTINSVEKYQTNDQPRQITSRAFFTWACHVPHTRQINISNR
jgi:hypothetical protein